MSGAAFEGLGGIIPQEEITPYVPGAVPDHALLATEVMALFESGFAEGLLADYEFRYRYGAYREKIRPLSEAMAAHGAPQDANAFLDEVIARIAYSSDLDDHPSLGAFIDPLVQVLFESGHNDFHIDLTPIQRLKGREDQLGFNLRGEKGRMLRASYRADAYVFARNCMHCELDLYGDCNNTDAASSSVLRFHGDVKDVGSCDQDSVFYVSSSTPIGVTSLSAGNEFHVMLEEKPRLMHWLKRRGLRSDIAHLEEMGFWERGNRLLVHDNGQMREYSP